MRSVQTLLKLTPHPTGNIMFCWHLIFVLMHDLLWNLPHDNALLWQVAFSHSEIAGLLMHCSSEFVERPLQGTAVAIGTDQQHNTPTKPFHRLARTVNTPAPFYSVVRYLGAMVSCSAKLCRKKFSDSLCVSAVALYQKRNSDPNQQITIYSCLRRECLLAERNQFTEVGDFNNVFTRVPSDLTEQEQARVHACIPRLQSPDKRKAASYKTPESSPSKRAAISSQPSEIKPKPKRVSKKIDMT
jgi:hypothetical protein